MPSRRRPALAVKRRNRNAKSLGVLGSGVSGDVGDTGLQAIDLQVGGPELVGEVLSAPPLANADLLDSSSYERRFITHINSLSEIDSAYNVQSGAYAQPRDSVGGMSARTHDLSLEQCEAWMRDLGLTTRGKPDWKQLLREAELGESQHYLLPSRWAKGEAPDQRAKVRTALERLEMKRRERTPTGAIVFALEEWYEIGRKLALVPEMLNEEISRVRPQAARAVRVSDARRVLETEGQVLLSVTPEPKKPRK